MASDLNYRVQEKLLGRLVMKSAMVLSILLSVGLFAWTQAPVEVTPKAKVSVSRKIASTGDTLTTALDTNRVDTAAIKIPTDIEYNPVDSISGISNLQPEVRVEKDQDEANKPLKKTTLNADEVVEESVETVEIKETTQTKIEAKKIEKTAEEILAKKKKKEVENAQSKAEKEIAKTALAVESALLTDYTKLKNDAQKSLDKLQKLLDDDKLESKKNFNKEISKLKAMILRYKRLPEEFSDDKIKEILEKKYKKLSDEDKIKVLAKVNTDDALKKTSKKLDGEIKDLLTLLRDELHKAEKYHKTLVATADLGANNSTGVCLGDDGSKGFFEKQNQFLMQFMQQMMVMMMGYSPFPMWDQYATSPGANPYAGVSDAHAGGVTAPNYAGNMPQVRYDKNFFNESTETDAGKSAPKRYEHLLPYADTLGFMPAQSQIQLGESS